MEEKEKKRMTMPKKGSENTRKPEAAPEKEKKQIPLRLSASMYRELAAWAEDEFRSVNGQIEYLLNECIKHRKGK